jgi:BT_3987-like, N-terminal domain/Domain of unknown function (DUF5627)
MKKLILYISLIVIIAGCNDQEIIFPDYTLQAVYFPIQLPLRTLSLGEDRLDNSLDRELKFDIGISIGGMYENKNDWTVDYVVDDALLDSVYNDSNQKMFPLPASYYTLSPENTAIIPKGSFNGRIRVQLTEDFLDDSLALAGLYAIPLRLTATSADSILSGAPLGGMVGADRRIVTEWEGGMSPKDWVLFGIKYVNAYHGTYLHRGWDIISQGGVPVDTIIYHKQFVEQDQLWKMVSVSKNSVISNGVGNYLTDAGTNYQMDLSFNNTSGATGSITISPVAGSAYSVTGTGEFFDLATSVEGFSGMVMQSMHLSYTFVDGLDTHAVSDTLVFRDRGIVYEELSIVINE